MKRLYLSAYCLFLSAIAFAASSNSNVQMQTLTLPPLPEIKQFQFQSYEDILKKSSALMDKYVNLFKTADTKNDPRLIELRDRCITCAQNLKDDFNSIMKKYSVYKSSKYCESIFSSDNMNLWDANECLKASDKLDKTSKDLLAKSEEAKNSPVSYDQDGYKIASGVAEDLSKTYKDLAVNYQEFEKACDDWANYCRK
jgi:hypothetical protein